MSYDPRTDPHLAAKIAAFAATLPRRRRRQALDFRVDHQADCPALYALGNCQCDPQFTPVKWLEA